MIVRIVRRKLRSHDRTLHHDPEPKLELVLPEKLQESWQWYIIKSTANSIAAGALCGMLFKSARGRHMGYTFTVFNYCIYLGNTYYNNFS
jgi:hypothetical protein